MKRSRWDARSVIFLDRGSESGTRRTRLIFKIVEGDKKRVRRVAASSVRRKQRNVKTSSIRSDEGNGIGTPIGIWLYAIVSQRNGKEENLSFSGTAALQKGVVSQTPHPWHPACAPTGEIGQGRRFEHGIEFVEHDRASSSF